MQGAWLSCLKRFVYKTRSIDFNRDRSARNYTSHSKLAILWYFLRVESRYSVGDVVPSFFAVAKRLAFRLVTRTSIERHKLKCYDKSIKACKLQNVLNSCMTSLSLTSPCGWAALCIDYSLKPFWHAFNKSVPLIIANTIPNAINYCLQLTLGCDIRMFCYNEQRWCGAGYSQLGWRPENCPEHCLPWRQDRYRIMSQTNQKTWSGQRRIWFW